MHTLKEPLRDMAKARVNRFTKESLGRLIEPLGFHDEADVIRDAFRFYLRKHSSLLVKVQQNRIR
jgi:hypothetical protein